MKATATKLMTVSAILFVVLMAGASQPAMAGGWSNCAGIRGGSVSFRFCNSGFRPGPRFGPRFYGPRYWGPRYYAPRARVVCRSWVNRFGQFERRCVRRGGPWYWN